ncbi:histidine kinase dimerization/phospho-acceptor domain-containing protein, partial [Mesorhizobium sp.]
EQVTFYRGGAERTFNVQITIEAGDDGSEEKSYVVTVDDITDLVQAQRSSAWADVARRIAHEIKNPLTPIQLSAERIKRRYGKVITEDREVFDQCTDTIIRQVEDIGRMVDEFSAFARMPKPEMKAIDLRESLREASFLVEVSRSDIAFER